MINMILLWCFTILKHLAELDSEGAADTLEFEKCHHRHLLGRLRLSRRTTKIGTEMTTRAPLGNSPRFERPGEPFSHHISQRHVRFRPLLFSPEVRSIKRLLLATKVSR